MPIITMVYLLSRTHACMTVHIPYARLYLDFNSNTKRFDAERNVSLHKGSKLA